MQVKEAVQIAKKYVSDLLQDEGMKNLGLEEVVFNEKKRAWEVTVGFSRPWNTIKGPLTTIDGGQPTKRAYRVVRVRDKDGAVESLTRRGELVD
ncbi:MAG: hypothetical protein AB7P20_03000 [Rhizobiaceae bacterium]